MTVAVLLLIIAVLILTLLAPKPVGWVAFALALVSLLLVVLGGSLRIH